MISQEERAHFAIVQATYELTCERLGIKLGELKRYLEEECGGDESKLPPIPRGEIYARYCKIVGKEEERAKAR